MPFVVVDQGEPFLLDVLVKVALASPEDWVLRLFKNDVSIINSTVRSDLTDADYDGYSPLTLTRSDWQDSVEVAGRAVSYWGTAPVNFTADSGTQNIYGWFVTNAANDKLLFAARLTSAPVEISSTNPVTLTPQMRLSSEYSPS